MKGSANYGQRNNRSNPAHLESRLDVIWCRRHGLARCQVAALNLGTARPYRTGKCVNYHCAAVVALAKLVMSLTIQPEPPIKRDRWVRQGCVLPDLSEGVRR